MKVHDLKTVQPYFDDVRRGVKTFEIRKNDRNYQIGDTLNLWEYLPVEEKKTGEVFTVEVVYFIDKFQDALGDNWCVLGIKPFEVPF